MGLDIYAGTLTRYYAHNWKTVVQQWAEENGYGFNRITPQGDKVAEEEEMTPEEIQACVSDWRDQVIAAIAQSGVSCTAWEENNEKDYYTDKPDWDAFGALILFGAAAVYGETAPETVEKDWNFEDQPLFKRVMEDQEKNWSLFTGATWWLPLLECLSFTGPAPTGQQTTFATAGTLLAELSRINELTWRAGEETVLSWAETEGYPTDGLVSKDGMFLKQDVQEHTQYHTESLAKFAYSILWRAANFSLKHQVPILLDY